MADRGSTAATVCVVTSATAAPAPAQSLSATFVSLGWLLHPSPGPHTSLDSHAGTAIARRGGGLALTNFYIYAA